MFDNKQRIVAYNQTSCLTTGPAFPSRVGKDQSQYLFYKLDFIKQINRI